MITVHNKLPDATSVHWHGVELRGVDVYADGMSGVTQRPIESGGTKVYAFNASNAGTLFYHLHHQMQRMDGAQGALIVDEETPPPFAYDEERIVFFG